MRWAPNLVGTGHPCMGMSGCCPRFVAEHLSQGCFASLVQGRPMQPLCRRDGFPMGQCFHPGADLGPLVPCLHHLGTFWLRGGRICPAELQR